jgi:methionyl-tRNA formyltransferase
LPSHEPAPELRLVFMGTPAFAVPSLRALLEVRSTAGRPARVVAVATQPDRPAGRGGRIQPGPVKAAALEAGLPVLQPQRLRRPESVAELRAYAPDLIVVAAYAQILSAEVLALPAYGCLNVHASLLPRWRGASPIAAAILAGDAVTGVTIMQMEAGLDTGPILAQREEPILADDTAGALTERLAMLGADLLAETLERWWVGGALSPRSQDDTQATLTRPLRREDGLIDWAARSAVEVERMARAYDPWPGAYSFFEGRLLKLWRGRVLGPSRSFRPGHVLNRLEAAALPDDLDLRWPQFVVACRDGLLLALRVQIEGRRPMDGADFMRGHPAVAGAQLASPPTG